MRRILRPNSALFIALGLCGWLVAGRVPAQADTTNGPSLVISQLKITSSNGQFITLYNTTNSPLDMSKYQLEYFNNYDLAKSTSSRLIGLSGTVPPHSYFMVNDSALLLCYQLTIDSLSLGLSSTAGMVEVLAFGQNNPGGSVVPILQDYVGWSKTAAAGAQTLPTNINAFLQRQPVDSHNNPNVTAAGNGSWQSVQPDTANPCNLLSTTVIPATVLTGLNQLLPGTEPPASIVTETEDTSDQPIVASLPASDLGLMAPTVSEILPNPIGTGNDATDEFIELYNANSVAFDLSGFALQVGTTALHTFALPAGTRLAPHSFTTFSSDTTGLSLSNSGGQAKLLDPFTNSISATDVYGTAKDGQAWALAKGKWYWTTSPTPGAANIIKLPVAKPKTGTKTAAKKSGARSKATKRATSLKAAKASGAYSPDDAPTSPIHAGILALVASLALLYGAYEYRADLANRIHQFRENLRTRRPNRP